MNYLIDTCVLSEFAKKQPNEQVADWFNLQQPEQLCISSITLAEIKKGLYKIQTAQPERFQSLMRWYVTVESKFSGRILPVSEAVLDDWADISATAELQGFTLAAMDSLIAATAHRLN